MEPLSAEHVRAMAYATKKFAESMQQLALIAGEATESVSAIPQPSTKPPMWAVNPQKSKRNPRSTRRVK